MANNRFSRLLKIVTGVEGEIFQLEGRLERWLHFVGLIRRQFVRNRCLVHAQALSYASLLAMIPLLAVALSVTSTLLKNQDEEKFYHLIDSFVANVTPPVVITNTATVGTNMVVVVTTNPPAAHTGTAVATDTNAVAAGAEPAEDNSQKEIAQQIRKFVKNTRTNNTLGVTGMILLVVAAISLLIRIEATFNDIWGITCGRHWMMQILLYWAVITLGPPLLITALGLAGGGHFQAARDFVAHMPIFGGLVFKLLPLLMLWLVFTLIYMFVPNTKVNFSAAVVGGFVGGSLWQLNNLGGFLYVSRVVSNSKLYGSLGLVPVFMIGLYFSWCILLFGAQVAYAFQNRAAYLQDRLAENVNQRGREFVALRLMAALGERFQNRQPPVTGQELSTVLGVPSRLTQSVLRILLRARLVIEIAEDEPAYVPARPLEMINVYDILFALRTGNGQELPAKNAALAEIYGEFARIEKAERDIASHISLLDLVRRVSGELPAPVMQSLPASAAESIEPVPPAVKAAKQKKTRPRGRRGSAE